MSALVSSQSKNGHLSGLTTTSLVNLDTAPTVLSSSYIDSGNQIHFSILFTADPTAAVPTATSFSFSCDQLVGITFNDGTINAVGAGTAITVNAAVAVVGVNASSNISVAWITPVGATVTVGQVMVTFVVTRA